MKKFILFIISFILISSCSTYYTDDEIIQLQNNLLQKLYDIRESLEKSNKDYIILYTNYFGSTIQTNDYLFVFVKEKDGYYNGTKYDIFRKFNGKPSLTINKQIDDLLKCINKDTINFECGSTLNFLYTINMKYKSKNYLFNVFELSRDISMNKCVLIF